MPDTFMGYVELNERAWGMEKYPGRPTLEEILAAKVVVFWRCTSNRKDPGYRVTLHRSIAELEKHAFDMRIHSNTRMPDRRLAKLFVNQRPAKIAGLKLRLEWA